MIGRSSFKIRAVTATAGLLALALSMAGCSSSSSGSTTGSSRSGSPAASPASAGSSGSSGSGVDTSLRNELPASVLSANKIVLGALFQTPPYISAAANDPNTPVGTIPELASAVGTILGVKIEWRNMQWPAQLPGVQAGTVDALWGQVTDTTDREDSVVDLVPFQKATESLLMNKSLASSVKSLADMCGKKVAVANGSVQTQYVTDSSKKSCADNPIKIVSYADATSAITAVKAGSVDAWMDATSSQDAAAAKTGLASVLIPESEIPATFTAVAVGKKETGLTSAFVGALQILIRNGTYGQIMEKWDGRCHSVQATA